MEQTIDDRADEYVNRTTLNPNTYKGDVQTAYCVGASDEKRLMEAKIIEIDAVFNSLPDGNEKYLCKAKLRRIFSAYWLDGYKYKGWHSNSSCEL